jgi:hypothetical protein
MPNPPTVIFSYDPPGPGYSISEQCVMPDIKVNAALKDFDSSGPAKLQFFWTATLTFTDASCLHSRGRTIKHPAMTGVTDTGVWKIPFTCVRGGKLTVKVKVTAGTATVSGESQNLKITGTNPTPSTLAATVSTIVFRKLMRVESQLRQFRTPDCPLFSADNLGGVGLCQMTNPTPTDDQVWSWKENVKAGWQLFQDKERFARAYPAKVRAGANFRKLVADYNTERQKNKLPAISIELPDYTSDQLQRDTIRGFNGYAGGLHEYQVKTDENGLVVTVATGGVKGTAEWETVTAAMRKDFYDAQIIPQNKRGDANYVNDVMAKSAF